MEEKDLEQPSINSGVAIFNNESLAKKRFKEKFVNLYKKAATIIDSRGILDDEAIFSILKIAGGEFDFHDIGVKWNNFLQFSSKIFSENGIILTHLHYKPWKRRFLWRKTITNTSPEEYEERTIRYAKLYMDFAKKIYKHKFYFYYLSDLIALEYIKHRLSIFIPTLKSRS